jgi:hypothetical protein
MVKWRALPGVIALCLVALWTTPASAFPGNVADAGVYMVDGPRVDDIVQVGSNTWIGGDFGRVLDASGSPTDTADGLTVFDASGHLIRSLNDALPSLGGSGRDIYDLSLGPNGVLYAAGTFTYSVGGKSYRNLIGINPANGAVVSTYNAEQLKAVHATSSGVYAGGRKLWRFPLGGGGVVGGWHAMTTYINHSLRGHQTNPSVRAIETADAGHLIVVGQFDWIDGTDSAHQKKVAVMVDSSSGQPDLGSGSWSVQCSCAHQDGAAFGLGVAVASGIAYIAAGGSDWAAAVRISDGGLLWQTDVNGSAQDIAVYDSSRVIVGGHYTSIEVSGGGDQGGSECPTRNAANQSPCLAQPRLAAISRSTGLADASWRPSVCCLYRGVWATMVHGTTIHVGGEFTRLDNDPGPEDYYGTFS